jgi:membrane protein implicated in regulation of membrane protease activity
VRHATTMSVADVMGLSISKVGMTAWHWLTRRTAEFWRETLTISFSFLAGVTATRALHPSDWTWWQSVLVAILSFLTVAGLRHVWRSEKRRAPALVGRETVIASANTRWLRHQGQVVVLTRDMTWNLDEFGAHALRDKARASELTIYVRNPSSLTRELGHLGARIVSYETLGWMPHVRFTILRHGASDAKVLIHRQRSGDVEFFEYEEGDFPAYWLAQDLADLLARSCTGGAGA